MHRKNIVLLAISSRLKKITYSTQHAMQPMQCKPAFSCTTEFTKCVRQKLHVASRTYCNLHQYLNRERHLWSHFTWDCWETQCDQICGWKEKQKCVFIDERVQRKDEGCSVSSRKEQPLPVTGYRGVGGDVAHSDLFIPPLLFQLWVNLKNSCDWFSPAHLLLFFWHKLYQSIFFFFFLDHLDFVSLDNLIFILMFNEALNKVIFFQVCS